jgi:beta-lactamase superfamily II metal-dependent hydrolase
VVDEIRRTLGFDPGPAGEVTVEFFDVGQADSALVSTGDTEILVDTGKIRRGGDVTSRLADAGVTDEVDVQALTHWHADHIGQVPEVLDAVDVDEIWHQPGEHDSATYDDAIAAIEASDATVRQPRQGETHTIGDLTVDIVAPSDAADPTDRHDSMLAVRIEHGDARVLFTGDAESETEARYVNRVPELLSAQLYQVGHHRSRTGSSQALLDAVQPDTAVYSAAADSQYGHPHAEALDRLNAAGAEIFGTDVNGTVTAASDGSPSWTVTPEREGTPQPGDDSDEDDEPSGCVDINGENDLDELQRIDHIGPERAQELIDKRPYSSLDDLQRIDGIGPSRVQDINDQGLAAVEC